LAHSVIHPVNSFAQVEDDAVRRADQQVAARDTHRSTKELEASIKYWIDTLNDEPKPFV
jgi:hypothetical protein